MCNGCELDAHQSLLSLPLKFAVTRYFAVTWNYCHWKHIAQRPLFWSSATYMCIYSFIGRMCDGFLCQRSDLSTQNPRDCITIKKWPFKEQNQVFPFLVANTQLYKRLCPSVRRKWSSSWKVGKQAFLILFVNVWVLGVGWGVNGGWVPLPTLPQRYCDSASLVFKTAYNFQMDGTGTLITLLDYR